MLVFIKYLTFVNILFLIQFTISNRTIISEIKICFSIILMSYTPEVKIARAHPGQQHKNNINDGKRNQLIKQRVSIKKGRTKNEKNSINYSINIIYTLHGGASFSVDNVINWTFLSSAIEFHGF